MSGETMADRAIRRDLPIPYYFQLLELLRERILDGTLAADALIPSEHELCATYGVSRTTVRQALGELVTDGLLYRVKGKGTYVAPRKLEEKFIQRSDGFYREMTRRGFTVTTAVLEQRTMAATGHIRQHLQVSEGARTIKVDRLRSVDDQVLLYVQTYLPYDLCPGLVDADLAHGSLYAVLREQYGLAVASGRRTVEAVPASRPLISLLGVAKGAPLLKIESVSFLPDGRPLEYYEAWHRADRSKFEIEVVAGEPSAPLPGPAHRRRR